MKAKTFKKYQNIFYPLITAALLLLLWYAVSAIVNKPIILPAPSVVLKDFFALWGEGVFWKSVLGSLWRAVRSFFYAVVFAAILSVIASFSVVFRKLFDPLVTVLRSVPTMSIILLALIWLSAASSPVLIAFLITFPTLYGVFLSALDGVDKDLIEMSNVYKVGKRDMVKDLYLPSVLPAAMDGMRSMVSLSLKVTIASEVMAQTRLSMGAYMQQSMIYFETAKLLAWTLAAIVFSYLLELAFIGLKKLTVRW